ncbi:MAG: hypothetical protein U1F23_07980 [Lysobacterales bacterium]
MKIGNGDGLPADGQLDDAAFRGVGNGVAHGVFFEDDFQQGNPRSRLAGRAPQVRCAPTAGCVQGGFLMPREHAIEHRTDVDHLTLHAFDPRLDARQLQQRGYRRFQPVPMLPISARTACAVSPLGNRTSTSTDHPQAPPASIAQFVREAGRELPFAREPRSMRPSTSLKRATSGAQVPGYHWAAGVWQAHRAVPAIARARTCEWTQAPLHQPRRQQQDEQAGAHDASKQDPVGGVQDFVRQGTVERISQLTGARSGVGDGRHGVLPNLGSGRNHQCDRAQHGTAGKSHIGIARPATGRNPRRQDRLRDHTVLADHSIPVVR